MGPVRRWRRRRLVKRIVREAFACETEEERDRMLAFDISNGALSMTEVRYPECAGRLHVEVLGTAEFPRVKNVRVP